MQRPPSPQTIAWLFDRLPDSVKEIYNIEIPRFTAHQLVSCGPPPDANSTVLDSVTACGTVTVEVLRYILQSGRAPWAFPRIYTCDHTLGSFDEFEEFLRAGGLPSGCVTLCTMDPRTLLFPDNLFTHAYCNRLTSWRGEDIQRVLAEIYRTLRPGGHAFFSIMGNFDWMPVLWGALNYIRPDERRRPLRMSNRELQTNLIYALTTAGFAVQEMRVYENPFVFQLDNPLEIYRWATIQYWPEIRHIVNGSECDFMNAFMVLLTNDQRQRALTTAPVFYVVARKSAGPGMRGARALR